MNCKGILMFARLKSVLERVKEKKKSNGFKIGRLTNQRLQHERVEVIKDIP